jgi:hypothetical protein
MLIPTVLFTAGFYFVLMIVIIRQFKYCRRVGEPLSWIVVAIHGLIYSAVFVFDYSDGSASNKLYNYWSLVLRVHFLATLIAIEWARLRRMEHKDGC